MAHRSRAYLTSLLTTVMAITVLPQAIASPLDVSDFASLGAFPSASGTYTFNGGLSSPTLVGPAGTITGVMSGDSAVFTFDSIEVAAGMTLRGGAGNRNIAILSKTSIVLSGLIDFRGGNGSKGPAGVSASGTAGPGGAYSGFGGAGSGFGSTVGGGGGGGFGGSGGRGGDDSSSSFYYGGGGSSFGSLLTAVRGGGDGGVGGHVLSPIYYGAGGGGGGGGLELGAIGAITIAGQGVIASGGNGGRGEGSSSQPAGGGGGGAGGGLLVHADSVALLSTLDVRGGAGGRSLYASNLAAGGGGAGGRVYINYVSGLTGDLANVMLDGGASAGDGVAGSVGQLVVVPEPSTLILGACGITCAAWSVWRRKAAA
jgi:hypothetical protein